MKPGLRKVLRFVLQFLPIFVVLLWIYPRLLPSYQPLPIGIANFFMERLPTPTRIEVDSAGAWQSYFPDGQGGERRFWRWEKFVVHLVYLNLTLLPALVLATPAPWRERLRLLALALTLLIAVHALTLIVLVRAYLCLYHAPGAFFCLWLLRIAYTSGQIFAAVLWAGLTWHRWMPGAQVSAPPVS